MHACVHAFIDDDGRRSNARVGRRRRRRRTGTGTGGTDARVPTGDVGVQIQSARVVVATSRAMDHACEGHPESNARVPAIEEALKRHGLTPETRQGEVVEIVGFASATKSALEGVHAKNYARGLDWRARGTRR